MPALCSVEPQFYKSRRRDYYAKKVEYLDALSRTRALTEQESIDLERAIYRKMYNEL